MSILKFESRNVSILSRTVDSTAVDPINGIPYLLNYGFAQSLQDSIAGLVKNLKLELREDGKRHVLTNTTKGMSNAERTDLHTIAGQTYGYRYFTAAAMESVASGSFSKEQFTEDELAKPAQENLYDMAAIYAVVNETTQERMDDIIAGTVAVRAASSAPKLDPVTRRMKELALAEVQKRIKARAAADPTAPTIPEADVTGYVELYFTKNYERLNTEALAFFNPPSATIVKTLDLSTLFGDEPDEGASEQSNTDEPKEDVA